MWYSVRVKDPDWKITKFSNLSPIPHVRFFEQKKTPTIQRKGFVLKSSTRRLHLATHCRRIQSKMAALQYLDSLRSSHPELSDWYNTLADLYQRKLWHQLTLKLEQFVALAVFQVSFAYVHKIFYAIWFYCEMELVASCVKKSRVSIWFDFMDVWKFYLLLFKSRVWMKIMCLVRQQWSRIFTLE